MSNSSLIVKVSARHYFFSQDIMLYFFIIIIIIVVVIIIFNYRKCTQGLIKQPVQNKLPSRVQKVLISIQFNQINMIFAANLIFSNKCPKRLISHLNYPIIYLFIQDSRKNIKKKAF